MELALFVRYFLDYAVLYPAAFLCLAPLREQLRSPRKTFALTAVITTAVCAGFSLLCTLLEVNSNFFLLPILILTFWALRWYAASQLSVSQTAFLFSITAVMMAVCSLLSVILNARAELYNDQPVCLVSTSLICLSLAAILSTILWFTAIPWSRWLLKEYRGDAFWQSAWPLPALYAAFLAFCMPEDTAIILMNRMQIISVLAVLISLLGIFLLLYEMYRVAWEYTRSSQLDWENQLLAAGARHYAELLACMEQTRQLRHDLRQHLHVLTGLAETGQTDELKLCLRQYKAVLGEEPPPLCANPAVDALAGYCDHAAHQQSIPVEWALALPRYLPIPESDLCVILGDLVQNALCVSRKLPPEQRRVRVIARMLSPAMMGLVVENNCGDAPERKNDVPHGAAETELVSVETVVRKYNGTLTTETQSRVFRVNILLNL